MIRRAIVLFAAMALPMSAHASSAAKFYQMLPGADQISLRSAVAPTLMPPAETLDETVKQMWRAGFVAVGYSSFEGPMGKQSSALKQAKKIGAQYVVMNAEHSSTTTGAFPLTMPTTSTSFSNGSVNAYGSGGFASGSYNGTTTTYGTSTTMIPYSIQRFNQAILYFAPVRTGGFGVLFGDVPDELKQTLGTNRAALVRAVRKGSPAFNSDVLDGDIITHVDGSPMTAELVKNAVDAGGAHRLTLWRRGAAIEKEVILPGRIERPLSAPSK